MGQSRRETSNQMDDGRSRSDEEGLSDEMAFSRFE